jgi:hypothetical protein
VFEFDYGVYPNFQMHLVAPGAFDKPSGEDTTHDTAIPSFGVK